MSIAVKAAAGDVKTSRDVNGVASNADFTSEVIDTRGYNTLWVEIDIDDASDPDYTISPYGGLRNSFANLRPLTLTEGDVSAETGVTLVSGAIAVDGSALLADAMVQFCIENPPRYVAVFGDSTGGAGTTGARVTMRYWLSN